MVPNRLLVLLVEPNVLGLVWFSAFEASARSWKRKRFSGPNTTFLENERLKPT